MGVKKKGPFPFTKRVVDSAPDKAGVYALYRNGAIIYIGRAKGGTVTIRSRLQDHLAGRDGSCTQSATHYWREVTTSPVSREVQLLQWFKKKYGRLPACNSRIG